MKLRERDVQRLFQRMTARHSGDSCLDENALMRVACGEATGSERAGAVEHIAGCSDCAREYQIARGLRSLRRTAALSARDLPLATAAMLIIAFGAVVWMAVVQQQTNRTVRRLQQQLEQSRGTPPVAESSRPQIGSPIVDLDADVTRGAAPSAAPIVVPPTASVLTLILHLPPDIEGPVDIDIDGRDSVRTLPAAGVVMMTLNRKGMRDGEHVIHVRGGRQPVVFVFSLARQ